MHQMTQRPLIILAVLLLIALTVGSLGSFYGWSFNVCDEIFWLLIAAMIGVGALLVERRQNTLARRTEIQLSFFDRWQGLITEIEKLEGQGCSAHAENTFRRYFELLHMEYLMREHLNPAIWDDWTRRRQSQFADPTLYAGKTFWDWWEHLNQEIGDVAFKKYIGSCHTWEADMAIWVSSDWHCDQNTLKQPVEEWITLGKEGKHRLIGNGDLFDILPLGKEQFGDADSIKQFAAKLGDYPFDYVAGNHDPYKTMVKLMAPYPNITVHKRLPLEQERRKYFVTHGHRWALDWGWLGLRHIAPWVVETMVDRAPGLWYKFCRQVGFLASDPPPQAPTGKETERITRLTRIIWAGASQHALDNNCCVVLGHTHTTGRRERGIGKHVAAECYMIDAGDLPDGSYVEITTEPLLKFL